jgi:hypothetical protein
MPLMKLYVDQSQPESVKTALKGAMSDLRALVCDRLDVPLAAAHLALIEHVGLPDQPQINIEIKYLGREDRTEEKIRGVGAEIRGKVSELCGITPAVRMAMLRPDEYTALK